MIGLYHKSRSTNKFLICAVVLMGIFLNQAYVIFGINTSLADIFLTLIGITLITKKELFLAVKPLFFFIVVSLFTICTAAFYVPYRFSYNTDFSILYSYLKLIVVFLYFLIGMNLTRLGLMKKALKWFSITSIFVALIGMTFTFLKIGIFSDLLYTGGIRFQGFMNDPNYFAILQIIAFAYFTESRDIPIKYRYTTLVILALSVLMSGSKTGMLTLLFYLFFKITEGLLHYNFRPSKIIKFILIIIFIFIGVPVLLENIESVVSSISQIVPAFSRVSVLFTDFYGGFIENGSGRDATWEVAINLIEASPILGIGIGTYTGVSRNLWDFGHIAHNTYLQLAVEWGLPLMIIFFSFVLLLIFKVTIFSKIRKDDNVIFRDILIILLFGSLAISLNNARIFWLVLGALMYSVRKDTKTKFKSSMVNIEKGVKE